MKRTTLWLWVAFITSIAVEILFVEAHEPHYLWQGIPGFHALLGLAGAVSLMGFAKCLGKYFLYRKENYYEKK